jgi:hypothetical protein
VHRVLLVLPVDKLVCHVWPEEFVPDGAWIVHVGYSVAAHGLRRMSFMSPGCRFSGLDANNVRGAESPHMRFIISEIGSEDAGACGFEGNLAGLNREYCVIAIWSSVN